MSSLVLPVARWSFTEVLMMLRLPSLEAPPARGGWAFPAFYTQLLILHSVSPHFALLHQMEPVQEGSAALSGGRFVLGPQACEGVPESGAEALSCQSFCLPSSKGMRA